MQLYVLSPSPCWAEFLENKGHMMKTDFKVYKRKIHVYREPNELDTTKTVYQYVWSTNAYRTCRDAIAAAVAKHPNVKFKASFAKD